MARTEQQTLSTYAEEDLTIADSSTRLTVANVLATPQVRKVEIFVEDAQVRVRTDGSAPTSSVGEILNPFDRYTLHNLNDAWNFRAIRTGSVSATLRIRYLR